MTTPQQKESIGRTITVINCNDWGWKWVFRGLWRGWGPRWTNLEGWHAACRPLPAWVIVPMCSALGCIPWGTAHTGGHLKAYLDVAAIWVRKSTQGSNLFQLLERARGLGGGVQRWDSVCFCVCVCVCIWKGDRGLWDGNISTPIALSYILVLLQFQCTA